MAHHDIIDKPQTIKLADFDPSDSHGIKKAEAEKQFPSLERRLSNLQDILYGAGQQSVLIVLQGMDTSGKDGTVKHVMSLINPTGCHVWGFKEPTPEELAHDFLWRIHLRTPAHGMIAIFNRSHYEDVLVARVHNLVPEKIWQERYEQINHFEHLLTQNGTIILKFFLHISKDEQEERLLDREKDPSKAWKLSVGDWHERAYWEDYEKAYEDALGTCGTSYAPWHIVPANKKWYRNHVIAQTIVDRLSPLESQWEQELAERGKRALNELQTMRAQSKKD